MDSKHADKLVPSLGDVGDSEEEAMLLVGGGVAGGRWSCVAWCPRVLGGTDSQLPLASSIAVACSSPFSL
jgi:hypothetical protein